MKTFFAVLLVFFSFLAIFGQNEQAPILEKDIAYKDWSFRNVTTSEFASLRELSKGKKLVIVVYFAPWCPNWKHDAPMVERLYEKYKGNGLEVIGVSEYDTSPMTRANMETFKITFPVYYESEERAQKTMTTHYQYRKSAGDVRNWGSPYYILLEPKKFEKGETLVNKTHVINGEMIETEGEKFIREKLGLPAVSSSVATKKGEIEVCEPEPKKPVLAKP